MPGICIMIIGALFVIFGMGIIFKIIQNDDINIGDQFIYYPFPEEPDTYCILTVIGIYKCQNQINYTAEYYIKGKFESAKEHYQDYNRFVTFTSFDFVKKMNK